MKTYRPALTGLMKVAGMSPLLVTSPFLFAPRNPPKTLKRKPPRNRLSPPAIPYMPKRPKEKSELDDYIEWSGMYPRPSGTFEDWKRRRDEYRLTGKYRPYSPTSLSDGQ